MPTDAYWAERERAGYDSGHVVARCPACHQRQMVAYSPPSVPWPRCKVCTGDGWDRQSARWLVPRVVPISDLSQIRHKRPGWPRNDRLLRQDGCVKIDPALRSPDATA
jgi:hypothetical protein